MLVIMNRDVIDILLIILTVVSDLGEIMVINQLGELLGKVIVPDYPEIIGMNFEK